MSEGGEVACDVIDRSVLASLRELQEAGDPDIVAEVGGLFIQHSPEKVEAIMKSAEAGDAKGLQTAAHSLKSSSTYIGAMRLSAMAKELELMGRTSVLEGAEEKAQRLNDEFGRVMSALRAEIEQISKKA
jgi:HPt (histidine-containing phosphotransfer) domain-containing protein